MADEFVESPEFEAFLDMLREADKKNKIEIMNPKRLSEMQGVYNTLQDIILEISPDAKIDCRVHKVGNSAGIVIEADEFVVHNKKMEAFLDSMKFVTNFEIHPLLNGNISMSFLFDGIVDRLYEK